MKIAKALAGEFTVYVPDRRGRGLSEPFGNSYCLQREVEDLAALIKKTDAHYLFGVDTGGLIILQAALTLPGIHKIALYQPHVYVNKLEMDKFNTIVQRMDQEITKGKYSSAIVTGRDIMTKVSGDKPSSAMHRLPGVIWKFILAFAFLVHTIKVEGDDLHPKNLLPTMKYDAQLVNETEGKLNNFKDVSAEVLLFGGSESPLFLKRCLDSLDKVLPNSNRIELQDFNQDSAQNYGKPELIAEKLLKFFR